ncbi:DUF6415 family natural product biosynthesis protein [Streptomyces mangrovisoli]|uniref:DUF6415 family natural product biosynthesis protein n=1 Tax=Streptomyces mangrovisoli TaxID=1428628 RepID=UPI0019D2AC11|nr:DUF6415 family natural product biosynthesis protein [Streptomyces mangrovisoli]
MKTALGTRPPSQKQADELQVRLPGHLRRLVCITVANAADPAETTAQLLLRARAVSTQDMSDNHGPAVDHLRRTARVVDELLTRLVELRCLREAV